MVMHWGSVHHREADDSFFLYVAVNFPLAASPFIFSKSWFFSYFQEQSSQFKPIKKNNFLSRPRRIIRSVVPSIPVLLLLSYTCVPCMVGVPVFRYQRNFSIHNPLSLIFQTSYVDITKFFLFGFFFNSFSKLFPRLTSVFILGYLQLSQFVGFFVWCQDPSHKSCSPTCPLNGYSHGYWYRM